MGGTRSRNKTEGNVRQLFVRKVEMVGRYRHRHDDRIEWMLEHTACLVVKGTVYLDIRRCRVYGSSQETTDLV
jgi:hypothetical protein